MTACLFVDKNPLEFMHSLISVHSILELFVGANKNNMVRNFSSCLRLEKGRRTFDATLSS